jgi:small subunit ribosomal protein S13
MAEPVKESKEFRGIVRIMGKDLKGQLKVREGLAKVKGIGRNLANAIGLKVEKDLGISLVLPVGELTDKQIGQIEDIIRDPLKSGVPVFMINHKGDVESGTNKHVVQSDLQIAVHADVERLKNSRSWRGWRTALGQKTRGQHNRTTGRSGMTVGVLKKSIKAQKEASKAGDKKDAAPAKK